MLKEMLQGGQEVNIEALWKAAFPEGWEAMPGKATGTGDWDQDMDYLESRLDDGLKTSARAGAEPVGDGQATSQPMSTTEPQREDEEVDQNTVQKAAFLTGSRGSLAAPAAGKEELPATGTGPADSAGTTTRVPSDQKGTGGGCYWETRCLLELMAIVGGAALVLMLCCAGVWYCWKRNGAALHLHKTSKNTSVWENRDLSSDISMPNVPAHGCITQLMLYCHHPEEDPLSPKALALLSGQELKGDPSCQRQEA
ncbi:uncharacterized protein LOC109145988 [Corvus cornix cornix]|uniref:uncharacterized protein LOC109145988 n=1 Tax=Corvus cornix cornix TaxID=932674 RepID=UPI0019524B6C|nr:uncharacterized protein LOC109145988 [Corvus cornix cornix]